MGSNFATGIVGMLTIPISLTEVALCRVVAEIGEEISWADVLYLSRTLVKLLPCVLQRDRGQYKYHTIEDSGGPARRFPIYLYLQKDEWQKSRIPVYFKITSHTAVGTLKA